VARLGTTVDGTLRLHGRTLLKKIAPRQALKQVKGHTVLKNPYMLFGK